MKLEDAVRDRGAADAVEAVAARDRVAAQLLLLALVHEADARLVGVDPVQADVVDLEEQGRARVEPRRDQVLDHLLLAVDRDRPALGELLEGDPVTLAVEAQLDPVVDEPLAVEPIGQPELGQQVDGALLEDAGPDALLDVLAAAILEHDGLDSLPRQKVGQNQPGRARRPRSQPGSASSSHLPCPLLTRVAGVAEP